MMGENKDISLSMEKIRVTDLRITIERIAYLVCNFIGSTWTLFCRNCS